MTVRSCSAMYSVVCALLISLAVMPVSASTFRPTSVVIAEIVEGTDSDGDGETDDNDMDDDNDGVWDDQDPEPLNPYIPPAVPTGPDLDGDGTEDAQDVDDDGDGIPDLQDYAPLDPTIQSAPVLPTEPVNTGGSDQPGDSGDAPDFDGDNLPDSVDPDDDNDGTVDHHDFAPFDRNIQNPPADPDNPDGTANQGDPLDPDIAIDPSKDSDGDGIPNDLDPDDNNNGVVDQEEPLPNTDDPKTPVVKTPTDGGKTDGKDDSGSIGSKPSNSSGTSPVVRSLPSTGTGSNPIAPTLVIALIAVLGLFAVKVRTQDKSEK